ncbi:MAG: hypothetical protein MPJ06_03655 [Nitrosopumilus sp.]|nr:hypothetical protein [Nitrosopumilus sp.]MDA7943085.1 hypothetical protein [Nitrosopumilus sp.]
MGQSRLGSLAESFSGTLVSAPTAVGIHYALLYAAGAYGLDASGDGREAFSGITWASFAAHSMAWRYFTRRAHERYGFTLDPRPLWAALRGRGVAPGGGSRLHTLSESAAGMLIAAPTAFVLLDVMLYVAGSLGVDVSGDGIAGFAATTWLAFAGHSIVWRYVIRRIYERHGYRPDLRRLFRR